MVIFWRLILAHLLTDFTFQTNFIAKWKREAVWGCIAHSLVFLLIAGALCYRYLTEVWVMLGPKVLIYGWMAILFLTIFHFFEDQWRIWTIQTLNSPDSFAFFLWDQFIHYVFIFVLFPQKDGLYPEKWVLLAILFILTTHFTTILIYYVEKDVFGQATMPPKKKYLSMLERLATAGALLLPGMFALSFFGVCIIGESIRRMSNKNGYHWTNYLLGNALAILFGLTARFIYY